MHGHFDLKTSHFDFRNRVPDGAAAGYQIGDRVRITNQSRNLIGKAVTERDWVGTVIKITRKRVFLRTDNGTNTNRAPKNLQWLP
jgi:hypothetical protein